MLQQLRQHSITDEISKLIEPVSVLYVSSYIPRKCGIANYTRDLTSSMNMLNPLERAEIAALDNNQGSTKYGREVEFIIKQQNIRDYEELAGEFNSNGYDVLSLQHEFGIYGGDYGDYVLTLLGMINKDKPIVVTLHTVLENPNEKQLEIIQGMCKKAHSVVVMLSTAKELLIERYKVDPKKIIVIHHGVPDFPMLETDIWKRAIRRSKNIIMTSINLIGPSRGIEYAIRAVPSIVKKYPNFIYQIVGETHPEYLKWLKGKDDYRNSLKKIVKDLGVEKNVKFINKYVSLEELIAYVGASDFYVTPYLEKQQASSGALAYAIGAGKTCISTPYLYAKEMLGGGRGMLVPFRNSEKISEKVLELLEKPKKKDKIEEKAYAIGRMMIWSNIAHQYFHLFHKIKKPNRKKPNGKNH